MKKVHNKVRLKCYTRFTDENSSSSERDQKSSDSHCEYDSEDSSIADEDKKDKSKLRRRRRKARQPIIEVSQEAEASKPKLTVFGG